MHKILFDKEDSIAMNIVQKCIEKLPKWDDVTRNMPFIITGSVGLAFVLLSRAEKKKQLEKEREFLEKKLKKDSIPIEKKNDLIIRQVEEEEEKKNDSGENAINNKGNHQHHFQTEKTEEKTPQSNTNMRFSKKINNKKNQQNDSGSEDESDEFQNGQQQQQQQQQGGNLYMNSSEYDFFNSHKYSQGEDDEEERFDKVATNDQISEVNSIHNMKTQVTKEKRQKRAPIRITKNFATDTENNEKLQKLKSIVQKEKKMEDKVFFQMFLNIVGTEAEQDDDD